MALSCPVSLKQIDANIVRLVAALISITAILFLLSGKLLFAFILFVDFALRFFHFQKFSPFFLLSSKTLRSLVVKPKLCDEAPKRFALTLGLGMSFAILLFAAFNLSLYAYILTVTLIICALFEALFDYCVGCKLYQLITYFKKG